MLSDTCTSRLKATAIVSKVYMIPTVHYLLSTQVTCLSQIFFFGFFFLTGDPGLRIRLSFLITKNYSRYMLIYTRAGH